MTPIQPVTPAVRAAAVRAFSSRGSWSLRTRLALSFGLLLTLATLNIAAFQWGARRRERVFAELHAAIDRHSALIEVQSRLDDHAKRVRMVVELLGVEHARLDTQDRERTLRSIQGMQRRLATATTQGVGDARDTPDAPVTLVRARTDSLAAAWTRFYERQGSDPAAAIRTVVVDADPLARRLLGVDLPAAIDEQRQLMQRSSAAVVRTDRTSSRLVWAILALSALFSAALGYTLSRDLLRAIGVLKAGVARFSAGDLGYEMTVTTCEELAEVGESLNVMARRLRQAHEELEVRNQELAHLAFRDPLTKLANRALFRERVEHSLAGGGWHRRSDATSILFIDLDDFKSVNDTLGHAAGDRLLIDVAQRLLDATRGSDTVARLGGDEFAILLHRVRDDEEVCVVAERVLHAARAPFLLDGRTIRISASIGVVRRHDGGGAEELLRNADLAMYRAKAAGKGQYTVFAPEMHAALLDRVELEAELRDALEREAIDLVYQPIVRLADRRVTCFEALVRWQHARRGAVPPSLFIPVAEEVGTIVPLGRWVMAQACREAVRWQGHTADGRPIGVSINVSGRQLDDAAFVGEVRQALAAAGLDAQCLTLEITETVIMRDSASTLTRLEELKALGIRVAIDDFGTGYSSLAYLQRFPVDTLKIDKAFVDQVARGGTDAALARTIVALGDTLGLRTIAEGIEEPAQHAELLALGCEYGQGYLFSRPLDPDDAVAFLDTEEHEPLADMLGPTVGAAESR